MAIDLKKQIDFSTIKNLFNKKGKGQGSGNVAPDYPTKRTMNLYQIATAENDPKRVALVGVLVAIALVAFAKFGVLDRLALVEQKRAELTQEQNTLATLKSSSKEYEEVKDLYDAYSLSYGSGAVDPAIVLALVEEQVKPSATVSNIVLTDGVLTLTLNDVSLEDSGKIASKLKAQEAVKSVNVSTATAKSSEGSKTVSTIVVTLVTSNASEEG